MENLYYVYIYRDPDTLTPFYVGMGKESRYLSHIQEAVHKKENKHSNLRKIRKIKKIISNGKSPDILFYVFGVSKSTASVVEKALISKYGRLDLGTGCLTNLTDGGDGGDTLSNHPNKPIIIEQMKKLRCTRKWWNNGSEQVHKETPPNSSFIIGRLPFNNIGSQIGAEIARNRKWINNGIIEYMIEKNLQIPVDFVAGRLSKTFGGKEKIVERNKKKKWWSNGVIEVHSETPPDEEFTNRRLPRLNKDQS